MLNTDSSAATFPVPHNEVARLETLHELGLMDTLPEQAYDDITLLASQICQTPISFLSLLDEDRQFFKSKVGMDFSETIREEAFCRYTILESERMLVVPDMKLDPRFADSPYVNDGLRIRFYAGAPLVTSDGYALGTLCVMDKTPRQMNESQLNALQALSRQVMAQFTLHQQAQEMQALNQQLERLSIRDELTGVNNRRAFNIALHREMAHAKRYAAPLSLVLLDVDAFKGYNDTFGHQAGDEVLRQVGQLLPRHVGEMAMAARYGGEEFALILPDTPAEVAVAVAEEVRAAFEQREWPNRAVTASFGVATTTSDLYREEELVARADAALYASKSAGRNRVTHCATLGNE